MSFTGDAPELRSAPVERLLPRHSTGNVGHAARNVFQNARILSLISPAFSGWKASPSKSAPFTLHAVTEKPKPFENQMYSKPRSARKRCIWRPKKVPKGVSAGMPRGKPAYGSVSALSVALQSTQ